MEIGEDVVRYLTEKQGGVPSVHKDEESGITTITHGYPGGGGLEVRSRKDPEKWGFQLVLHKGQEIKVPVALDLEFHGKPCADKVKEARYR